MTLWGRCFLGLILFATSVICLSQSAHAKLLITPLHIVIEGRERSGEVIVVNTSNQPVRYRFGWSQVEQSEALQGGYVDTVMDDSQLYLQNFAVFSPRQITLKPGEKQTVRIAVRRPADLADAEYKSHLQLSALSTESGANTQISPGIGAKINFSYSIPIVYRVGEQDIQIDFGTPSFETAANGNLLIKTPVNRSGTHGVIGRIDVYHTPSGGKEKFLTNVGGANLFPEINSRTFNIHAPVKGLEPGTLRFVFLKAEGKREDYTVLSEKIVNVQN